MKISANMVFRPVKESDWPLLAAWRNDPLKLANQGRKEPHSDEENTEHLRKIYHQQFLAVLGKKGVVIGGILIQNRGDGYLGISWSVGLPYRGMSWGKCIAYQAAREFPGKKRALIKKSNKASIRCAEYAGYKRVGKEKGFEVYIWDGLDG